MHSLRPWFLAPFALGIAHLACVHPVAAALPLPQAAASVPTPPPSAAPSLCREALPEGHARPKTTEVFPDKVLSGYVATLEITVEHEAGETVMPGGAQVQLDSKEATELEHQGFILPSPKGPSRMGIERQTQAAPAKTKVSIPLLVLAKDLEHRTLTLPSLPVSIARANGEVYNVCTTAHTITLEDPTSSTPNAMPKGNPPPRRQLEEWTALKQGLEIGSIALIAGALLAVLFLLWRRRPKRLPPPPPPRPAWEVAFEELGELRRGELVQQQRFGEHFDRASDVVRKYLGARFGFDGLESTTKEMVGELRSANVDIGTMNAVELFLRDADLVKFAKRTPTEAECWLVLDHAEGFVRSTLPAEPNPTSPQPVPSPREPASPENTTP
jgi:hypothetical protein